MSLDVLPADVPAEYAPAMVAACSDALAEGRCVLAATLPESTQPEAVALVLWQGEGLLQVTVRVGRGGGQWVARALTFSERDSIAERWTTVGLTVATLVGETRALNGGPGTGASERPPEPEPKAPRQSAGADASSERPAAHAEALAAPPATRQARVQHPPSWQGDLGFLSGPGWSRGGWQYGGWASLGFRVPGWPVLVHALGSYTLSSGPSVLEGDTTSRFATVGIGAGVFGTLRALDVTGSASLELAYRRIDVSWRGKATGDRELPVRLRVLAAFPAEGAVAVTAGVSMRVPPGNTNESGASSLSEGAVSAEVLAGLEVRL